MVTINRLREYVAETVATMVDDEDNKLFNYSTIVLDNEELSKILQERKKEDNTFLIAVMPEFGMNGDEDNAKWSNMLQFLVLDKTAYSDINREEYLNIFAKNQIKARDFIYKMLEDKSNSKGMFCGFLSFLKENSISVNPIKQNNGCNGWSIEIDLETNL